MSYMNGSGDTCKLRVTLANLQMGDSARAPTMARQAKRERATKKQRARKNAWELHVRERTEKTRERDRET